MKSANPTLFTPLLGAFYFFYFALVGVYIIFMPKVLHDAGYSAAEVGTIYAAAPFMRFLLPFAFKYFLPLNARTYQIALMCAVAATLLFFFTLQHFGIYFTVNLLFGASMGVTLPYVETIALSKLDKTRYGKVRLWGSIGFMAVALWLGKVLESSTQALWYLFAATFFTMIFGLALLRFDHVPHESAAHARDFSLRRYWAFWVSVFLMQVGFGGFYNFFTIYETSHGISLEVTGWMWSFGVICEIAMLYFQGPLLRRNLLRILQAATLITAVRWLLLWYFADSAAMTFISQSLHAVSFALYHTAAISYVFSLYSQKRLAQQFFLGIAFGLGGAVGALLAGKWYGENLFLYEAAVTFAAFTAMLWHEKRKKEKADV